ncbi:hypothetical protein PCASD_07225 [Puccinia coronata f. sp. avenae]|uniref:DDE Tnp4 domain-containing protein n=1 Tax=Puccinia coronata f. sp. avenae TaxID=200324 RepID=A0A2N5UYM5_9BASI|nr:hypothetical protein PCASD_07225 [Puccinia coronata f. sp. avenae]
MPRETERGKAIKRMTQIIRTQINGSIINSLWKEPDEDSSGEDSDLGDALVALIHLKKRRYMKERVRIIRAPNIGSFLFDLDEACFKQEFRMTQHSFYQLLDEIKSHPVFHNQSNIPQRPVKDQLMVTLKRMGTFGNVEAILSLQSKYVCWPDVHGRQEISSHIGSYTGFKQCVGFVDGTLFPLDEKPSVDSQDYYSRKGSYGLAALIVCDETKRILYCLSGWPGCCHDTRLWENSELNLKQRSLFLPGEYLIGNSGFPTSENLIPAFKRPANGLMPRPKKQFNQHLASLRVCNEHCIGILKGRFQSLQGLRKDLSSVGSLGKINHWISACVILHNFLLGDSSPDVYNPPELEDDEEIEQETDGPRRGRASLGNQLCDRVFQEVIDYLD